MTRSAKRNAFTIQQLMTQLIVRAEEFCELVNQSRKLSFEFLIGASQHLLTDRKHAKCKF